jgi:hypothetical protein
MALPEFIDEPILVQARFFPDGRIEPTAFIWRNRTRYIADWGRQWQEDAGGQAWQCYLVRTPNQETFDLRYAPTEGRWKLHRAWLGTDHEV